MHSITTPFELSLPEACFRLPAGGGLEVADGDAALLQCLRRKIAAVPGDLLAHTRRIVLARNLDDGAELLGALIDLFIATGSRGYDLKRRLLLLAVPQLPDDARRLLERCLKTGLSGGGQLNCPESVLANVTSPLKFVSKLPS